jgi:Uma2 family endonuclease
MRTKTRATLEDLYRLPENGKAELVHGEIVRMPPTGGLPGRAATKIAASLSNYETQLGIGYAFGDNVGFAVNLPNRKSFSPDAAWFTGELTGMKFLDGAPDFAVEVRSEHDYGWLAEAELAQKRADYFAAGTQVVWDVDLLDEAVIKKYVATDPANPIVFRRGEMADAEPAVPGWRFPVDTLFRLRQDEKEAET